jgi:hypothetical protein
MRVFECDVVTQLDKIRIINDLDDRRNANLHCWFVLE